LLGLASAALCQGPPKEDAGAPSERRQRVERFVGTRPAKVLEANYLLYLPASYPTDASKRWPLIVHLHGGGGRGDDPARLEPYPLVRRLEDDPDFPFVVVTPQCPYGERDDELGDTWVEHADLALAVVDEVVERYRIDPDRVSLVGHSMGGNGAWYLGHREPRRWAAIVPMSAPAVTWWAYRIAEDRVPTWVFHGALDEAVPVAESRRMVEAMKRFDGDVRLTIYPEGGHAIREPFEGDELYDWLLEQRRGSHGPPSRGR
jgi:predicted peptidase